MAEKTVKSSGKSSETEGTSRVQQLIDASESIPFGFLVFRPHEEGGQILAFNSRIYRMCGCASREEFMEYTRGIWRNLTTGEDYASLVSRTARDRESMEEPWYGQFVFRVITKSGRISSFQCTGNMLEDPKYGRVYIQYFSDFDEYANKNIFDSISGLHQKDYLFRWIKDQQAYNISSLRGRKWHMIFINISGFKAFNDDCGYEEGNRLLRDVADLMQDTFGTELMTRIYADQFAVMYGGDDAEERVTRLHDKALGLRRDSYIWVRAGIYDIRDWNMAPEVALDYAKTACDEISGGKQFCNVYSDELKARLEKEKYIISHIDEAIQKGWVVLYFQPVVRTLSGKICSGEALARWIDPKFGMISPGEFVPALEENGLSYKLAEFVINEAARFVSTSERMGMYPVPVSINLSRKDFEGFDPFIEVEKAVKKYRISRNLLCIEITESTAMENPGKIRRYIERFHEAGYEVWMDDFGSAYSSLNALKDFDFDEIKLDMVFMRNFNDKAKKIVASCVNMAKDLGIHTLCEGVETKEQADFLLEHGCEKIQGFYYSRPRPVDELRTMINEGKFDYERSVERSLYDRAGKLKLFPGQPEAVILYRNGNIYPLEVSESLRKGALEAGFPVIELKKVFHMENTDFGQRLRVVISQSIETSSEEEIAYFLKGHYYMLRTKLIAGSHAGDICVLRVSDISESAKGIMLANASPVVQSLVSIYDCIYKVDTEKRQIEVVASDFSGEMNGSVFPFVPEKMSAFVYQGDRERFMEWARPEHIREVLSDRTKKSCSDLFRIVRPDGTRVWELFTVLRGADRDENRALLCMKPSLYSDTEIAERTARMILDEERGSGKGYERKAGDSLWTPDCLWKSILEQDKLKIFWKDRNRRFVGASASFLNYFGLESADDIIGKTDEECHWHIDDNTYRDEELDVLGKGRSSANIPGKVISRGTVRDIIATKFPVYNDGKVTGLVGVFSDIDEFPMLQGKNRNVVRRDPGTGVMSFYSWINELSGYEDNYNRNDENYVIGVLVLNSYWKVYHEFGKDTAEDIAAAAAEAMEKYLPEGCIIGRADRETFTVATKNVGIDLSAGLKKVTEELASEHMIGTFRGMIPACAASSSRNETNNPIRAVGVTIERAEQLSMAEAISVQGGMRIPEGTVPAAWDTDVSEEKLKEKAEALLDYFDSVRIIDPEGKKTMQIGGKSKDAGKWTDLFEEDTVPGSSGNSLDLIKEKTRTAVFDTDGADLFAVVSRYMQCGGKPAVIEATVRINDDSRMSSEEKNIFIRTLAKCRAKLYEDSLTGIHNRRYYEDVLSLNTVTAAVIVDIIGIKDINGRFGHLAGDAVIRSAAREIESCVRYNDLVRFGGDRFLIGFRGIGREAFEKRISSILKKINAISLERYPDIKIGACAGGVFGEGTVRELAEKAGEALDDARKNGKSLEIL